MPAKKPTVLVVDDDLQIQRMVTRNLQLEGYETLTASNGQEALDSIASQMPDIVLLDVMMPVMDGFTVCERVRSFSAVPIIILTARGQEQDKVRGLDLGADDYLTKPFGIDELLARVRAVLRRSEYGADDQGAFHEPVLTIGPFAIDFAQHQVQRDGHEISMTPIEYAIFAYLARNAGRVLTQNMILEQVWGAEYAGEYHMLQVNINRLRRKIEDDPAHPQIIVTKPGIGYQLVAP
jgi:DNA-binding response OmpR family regulator